MPRKKSSRGNSPDDSSSGPSNPLREIHAANAAAAAANAALIDKMNLADASKPFKNPSFKRGSARRNKPTKAIIQAEKARFDAQLTLYADNARAAKAVVDTEMQVDQQQNPSRAMTDLRSNYKALEDGKKVPTYWNIEAPPPLIPPKHYCDLTGLPAPYTDPKTNLRYHSKEIYAIIKGLPHGAENAYLGLRNAAMVLK